MTDLITTTTDTGTYQHCPERDMLAELDKAPAKWRRVSSNNRRRQPAPAHILLERYLHFLRHRPAGDSVTLFTSPTYPVVDREIRFHAAGLGLTVNYVNPDDWK